MGGLALDTDTVHESRTAILERCVEDACRYLGGDLGWNEYGTARDQVRASYQSLLTAPTLAGKEG